MNTVTELIPLIENGALDSRFAALYGADNINLQRGRYIGALGAFAALYGAARPVRLFSVPGRSEISGNHTDHNHGRVLAASVDLYIIAVASPNADGKIRIKSQGFDEDVVSAPGGTKQGD